MIHLLLALIYLAFISLGLPDAVLGSAWPLISEEFMVPISRMGIVTIIISAGTIVSSLKSNVLIHKFGVHKVTTLSIALTALSLVGFAKAPSFMSLCLWAVPYGLGAGSVDAALNNYVAIHFESKHMNWLHCMWGVGATLGPYIMGMALTSGHTFRTGYMILFAIQAILSIVIFISAPVWKQNAARKGLQKGQDGQDEEEDTGPQFLSLKEIFKINGVKEIALAFFCFCALEMSTGAWASSYLVYNKNVSPEIAASFTALFYLGITVGRGICGFIAIKYNDTQMIRGGACIMFLGLISLFLPFGEIPAFVGIGVIGLGSAPVYPAIIHSTPINFGVKNSQAIIGILMASAYTGTLLMPALFGILARTIGFFVYPIFIAILLLAMIIMHERMLKKV